MSIERTQQHMYELNTESRLTKLETTNELIAKTLIEINTKIDKLDNKIDHKISIIDNKIDILENKMDKKIDNLCDSVNKKIDQLDNRLWYLFAWTSAGFVGLFTIMAHGFDWI